MLTFREITEQDRAVVLPMVEAFYSSDAVSHAIPRDVIERTFAAAVDPDMPMLRGVVILCDGEVCGYLYLTFLFAGEVGGVCVMLEEIFFLPEFRGRGFGLQAMKWIESQYPEAMRFRLEVTQVNEGAVHLYEKCGYKRLTYDQMVLDRI